MEYSKDPVTRVVEFAASQLTKGGQAVTEESLLEQLGAEPTEELALLIQRVLKSVRGSVASGQ